MPNVQLLIGAKGATFRRGYVPYPLCCPSRASLLTGEYMHNHLVRGNVPPFGGWDAFRPQEANALPVWTKDAGYYNLHIGKYLNGYAGVPATPLPVPTAWDEWYGKISEGPLYFNYQLIEKTAPADTPELEFYGDQAGEYQTDVLGDKAVGVRRRAVWRAVPVPDEPLVQRPPQPLRPGARATSARSRPPRCRRSRHSTRRTSRTSRSGCASSRRSAFRRDSRRRSPSSAAAASRCCDRSTRRSASWSPSSKARGCSTTPTSSSPPTTASSAASTGSPAASTWPTTPRPRCH